MRLFAERQLLRAGQAHRHTGWSKAPKNLGPMHPAVCPYLAVRAICCLLRVLNCAAAWRCCKRLVPHGGGSPQAGGVSCHMLRVLADRCLAAALALDCITCQTISSEQAARLKAAAGHPHTLTRAFQLRWHLNSGALLPLRRLICTHTTNQLRPPCPAPFSQRPFQPAPAEPAELRARMADARSQGRSALRTSILLVLALGCQAVNLAEKERCGELWKPWRQHLLASLFT